MGKKPKKTIRNIGRKNVGNIRLVSVGYAGVYPLSVQVVDTQFRQFTHSAQPDIVAQLRQKRRDGINLFCFVYKIKIYLFCFVHKIKTLSLQRFN